MSKGFKVTVEDLDNGETQSMVVGTGEYVLIPFAPCHLTARQVHSNGTVQITLKGHSPRPVEQSEVQAS